jgi:Rieske Fe-S protein
MERIHTLYRVSRRIAIKAICYTLGAILFYKILDVKSLREKNSVTINIEEVPVEGGIVLTQKRLAIVNYSNKLQVFSLVCPHLGCTISLTDKNFKCPCHGSEFDLQGHVIKGPANRGLSALPFKVKGAKVIIYT